MFPRANVPASMVIRTGRASIEVDSLEQAVSQVPQLAGRIGGYVANTTVQTGRGQLRSANLELKIPAQRFEEGLSGLAGLGKLESVKRQGVGIVIPVAVLVVALWVSAKRLSPLATRSAGR